MGKLFGDKSYISKALTSRVLERVPEIDDNAYNKEMKAKLMNTFERLFLRKCSIIETINDQNKERFPDRVH